MNLDWIFEKNFLSIADFEGFSPHDMHWLLFEPFNEIQSPLRINLEIDDQLLPKLKIFYDIIHYLNMLKDREPLKLTQKGNLPRNFCRELHDLGIQEEELLVLRSHPIYVESDSPYIHIINLFTKMLGLTKKRQGKISLTKKAINRLKRQNTGTFFGEVFSAYTRNLNWAYGDGYPESWIIQTGFGFSMYLVQKYGNEPRETEFYARKYLKAFPAVLREFPDEPYVTGEESFKRAYILRVFRRFLKRFGFIDMPEESHVREVVTVMKTPVIDQIVKWNTQYDPKNGLDMTNS